MSDLVFIPILNLARYVEVRGDTKKQKVHSFMHTRVRGLWKYYLASQETKLYIPVVPREANNHQAAILRRLKLYFLRWFEQKTWPEGW